MNLKHLTNMDRYIDSEKLIAEIERYKQGSAIARFDNAGENADYFQGKVDLCDDLTHIIASLQQEQPIEGKQVIIITETNGDANIHWDCRSLDDARALLTSAKSFITDKQIEELRGQGSGPDYNTTEGRFRNAHKFQQEQPNNMIQWIGNNLKEVIDFTGKSPKFGEWFSSWEEYENYVHAHNDILKLFCEDGSHYEVPVGAWIVKTPDGYNVPSIAKYIQQKQSDNWDKQYQEDELQTRFAFYTYKDENNILYLSNVFVEEASRCKGFGTKILQAAEKVAETIGATSIRLRVKQNSQVNDWYRKHGYGYLTFEGKYDWLEKNLEYLKPKQEQQEVDLEEEITAYIEQHFHIRYDETLVVSNHPLTTYNFEKIALHFYELGLNARKEEL